MGRRRRKVIRVVKKRLPTVFVCPSCGEEAVKVLLSEGSRRASTQCGSCGIKDEFDVAPTEHIVDIYCKFTDRYYCGATHREQDEQQR